ncbi:MAG: hypothetical protein ACFFFD_04720 [Promethearchaeota archaeon]
MSYVLCAAKLMNINQERYLVVGSAALFGITIGPRIIAGFAYGLFLYSFDTIAKRDAYSRGRALN